MAECTNCHTETQPGDLVSKLVDGHFKFFCSEQCYSEHMQPKTAAPSEAPSSRPVAPPPTAKKPQSRKAPRKT